MKHLKLKLFLRQILENDSNRVHANAINLFV